MALNAASHNTTGEKTGPISGQPPSASSETTAALLGAAKEDPVGQHQGGHDGVDKEAGEKVKSEKQLEKERKQAEKDAKFKAKKAKAAASGSNDAEPKKKEKKEKKAKADGSADDSLPEYVEKTPVGQKKILGSLDDGYHKAYIPKVVESGWYSWWEKEGYFEPKFDSNGNVSKKGYFVISEPPPNVTGKLHMGHALPNALQDTLIRWSRMKGLTTLWLPGCDHAGISTQSVVENMLWRREKKTRYDLGRERFVNTVWDWKEEYHQEINKALKRMGGSFDWTREAFTMDANLSAAVTETFVRLHEEGIIYRANRLVNWCTKLNTAISNLEVDNIELEGRTLLDVPGYDRKVEFGVITHFCYKIDGSDEKIEVATTRPETMLGDSGIAVNPKDERYKHLVGKKAKHPFVDRLLPIFTDDYVDLEFGTGAVKMTPAHDPNDFTIGKRHNLEFINILNDDGTLNHNTGAFAGQKRFEARYKVIEALKKEGLYVKWEHNPMKVPLCDKSKDVIEPLMKPQWWMSMRELADEAVKAVKDGRIKIRPELAERSYFKWLEGINDWCLSRQLWWGHQAPAYFIEIEDLPGDDSDGERWVTGRTEEAALEKAKAKFPDKSISLRRDEDVLDTWFSSGLWPFSTLGWPKETHDMKTLYPTSVLETGWDILFFWVARMIMLGLKLTGEVPFREVYCHSLVRDSEGRKMSKSLGNVIDPLDVMQGIELEALHDKLKVGNLDPKELAKATKFQKDSFPNGIPECGADALRFSLISYTTGGGDIAFDVKVMHGYRRFCNKIYQATRYVLGKLPSTFKPQPLNACPSPKISLAERWILHKLTITSREINEALTEREFSDATTIVYQYWYNHLCDVYIENSKSILQSGSPEEQDSALQTLYTALERGLTMIHPMMPFLTEELWQRLPRRPEDSTPSIVVASYPVYEAEMDDPVSEEAYELILAITRAIRSLTAAYNIKDHAEVTIQLFDDRSHTTCTEELDSIRSLCGAAVYFEGDVKIIDAGHEKPRGSVVAAVNASATVCLKVIGRIDIDAEIEKARKKLNAASDGVKKQRTLLDDEKWQQNADAKVQDGERKKMENWEAECREMEESIASFEKLKLEK